MDTPKGEGPGIIDIVMSKLDAALSHVAVAESRINESLARQEKSAAERDAALRRDMERHEAEAVKRETALRREMEKRDAALRRDMEKRETEAAKREARIMQWCAAIAAAAVVALGLWIDLRDRPATPPVTVNTPPPVIYTAPPPTPPVAADAR